MIKHCLYFLFLICVNCYSQKAIKDTIIDGRVYRYSHNHWNGQLASLSQNKTRKEGGDWIYFDRKGKEMRSGKYNTNGKKEGAWWYKKREITYYKDGKKTGMGSGFKGLKKQEPKE